MNTTAIKQCAHLAEVRAEIDAIDEGIVALLAQRQCYVAQAGALKQDVAEVPAPARVEAVIQKVTARARVVGAQPEVVEAVYRAMIAAFIAYERVQHSSKVVDAGQGA